MAGSDDLAVWRAALRLVPVDVAAASEASGPVPQPPQLSSDHRDAVENMMRRCALVLCGDRPLEAMRRCSSRHAFRQFTRLRRRLDCRPGDERPRLRASHTAIDHHGDLDIVATVRRGGHARALTMRMCVREHGWRLTQCEMVA